MGTWGQSRGHFRMAQNDSRSSTAPTLGLHPSLPSPSLLPDPPHITCAQVSGTLFLFHKGGLMGTLPWKPNPQMAFPPGNLGWLPNKLGAGCGAGLEHFRPAQAPGAACCGASCLVSRTCPSQVSRMRSGPFHFVKEWLPCTDMACHVPRVTL